MALRADYVCLASIIYLNPKINFSKKCSVQRGVEVYIQMQGDTIEDTAISVDEQHVQYGVLDTILKKL